MASSLDAVLQISIHALREEGDRYHNGGVRLYGRNFNPRPPRGGRRCGRHFRYRSTSFQSTPSARRATSSSSVYSISPIISIHALREEGDVVRSVLSLGRSLFQSTPSARRATTHSKPTINIMSISIHALREEGDPPSGSTRRQHCDFNPRPPRGGRPSRGKSSDAKTEQFQSTPSARRATRARRWTAWARVCYFNPRPPRGGRLPWHPP